VSTFGLGAFRCRRRAGRGGNHRECHRPSSLSLAGPARKCPCSPSRQYARAGGLGRWRMKDGKIAFDEARVGCLGPIGLGSLCHRNLAHRDEGGSTQAPDSFPELELSSVRPTIWRVSRAGRMAGWALVGVGVLGGAIGLFAVFTASSQYWWAAAPVTIGLALVAAYGYRGGVVPSIEATEQEINIRNPLGRRKIPWSDVVEVSPSAWGLRITLRDGTSPVGWAVQKSNWSIWNNRRTRADNVAQILTREAHRRKATKLSTT
jgi:hypothetical protein